MKTIDMEIRFTDVDSQNHVNHTAIIEWISHARVKLIDDKLNQYEHFLWKDKTIADGLEFDYVLVNLDISFIKEVFYPGIIEVKAGVLSVGNKSLTTEFFVYSGDEMVVEAQCINVFFRTTIKKSPEILKGIKPVDIPNKLKDILTKEKNGNNRKLN